MASTADQAATTRTPGAQHSAHMHVGPKMRQLMAKGELGGTPEQIAFKLAQSVLHSIYAASTIVTAILDGERDDGDSAALLGLEAVLKQARKIASDLDEVLNDADRSERPLKLRLEPEASHV